MDQSNPQRKARVDKALELFHQAYDRQMSGELEEAIDVDPEFGNPYNDIGAYLIEMERLDDAIPWLERATTASRYESYHFPWFNLGRVYEAKEQLNRAIECYTQALAHDGDYAQAQKALRTVRVKIN
jgi:Tfp pilus assembly protein PilF